MGIYICIVFLKLILSLSLFLYTRELRLRCFFFPSWSRYNIICTKGGWMLPCYSSSSTRMSFTALYLDFTISRICLISKPQCFGGSYHKSGVPKFIHLFLTSFATLALPCGLLNQLISFYKHAHGRECQNGRFTLQHYCGVGLMERKKFQAYIRPWRWSVTWLCWRVWG